jgi:hypothetical protein
MRKSRQFGKNQLPFPAPYDHRAIYKFERDFTVEGTDKKNCRIIRQAIINAARRRGVKITTRTINTTIYVWLIKNNIA